VSHHALHRRVVNLLGTLCVAGGALAAGASGPARLGQVYGQDPQRRGALITRGQQVFSGEVVKALDHGALVRLEDGGVLKLGSNSAVRLEAGPEGEVRVLVLSGTVAALDEQGRVQVAGQRAAFSLWPAAFDPEAAESLLIDADLEGKLRREEDARTRPPGVAAGR